MTTNGGFADQLLTSERAVIPLPDGVDPANEDVPAEITAIADAGAAQVLDFVGADETTALAPEITAGGDHHIIGYGGHVHEPTRALVDGEFSFVGNTVGRDTELQELVALVEDGDVDLHTSQGGLREISEVAQKLEHGEIDGRVVITP